MFQIATKNVFILLTKQYVNYLINMLQRLNHSYLFVKNNLCLLIYKYVFVGHSFVLQNFVVKDV